MKQILILNCHPDDDVLSFGGLISKAKKLGDKVFIYTFCVGGPCSNVSTEIRERELKSVMEYLGCEYQYILGYDGLLDTVPTCDLTGRIDDLIQQLKPEEVYVSPNSEHGDHAALYKAFLASCRLKSGWMPKLTAVGTYMFTDQLYPDILGGKIYQPMSEDDYQKKLKAFRLYKSQYKPSPNPLGEDGIRVMSEYHGMMCGHKYAELYYQLRYIREK